ncbi:MAG: hypothetical protein Q9182_006996 [Xanthomendoza sp. 2 TL-2023]
MIRCRSNLQRPFANSLSQRLPPRTFVRTSTRPLAQGVEKPRVESPTPSIKWYQLWIVGAGLVGSGAWLGYTGVLSTWLGFADETHAAEVDTFQEYELIKNQKISATSYIFKIQPLTFGPKAYKTRLDGQKIIDASQKGIWSVQIKHPLITIARLYTPIPNILQDPFTHALGEHTDYNSYNPRENQLRFLLRNHPEGELSRFLSRLQPGARVELRGPFQEFKFPPDLEHVVFLAGGTGIAPALQMADALLQDKSNTPKPKMTILWANRFAEDCKGAAIESAPRLDGMLQRAWRSVFGPDAPQPTVDHPTPSVEDSPIVRELYSLKTRYPANFNIRYFADDHERFITEQDLRATLWTAGTSQVQSAAAEGSGAKLIMVSGPDGFVEHFAGPKVWKGGMELQGDLGGVLKRIGLSGWTVGKL